MLLIFKEKKCADMRDACKDMRDSIGSNFERKRPKY